MESQANLAVESNPFLRELEEIKNRRMPTPFGKISDKQRDDFLRNREEERQALLVLFSRAKTKDKSVSEHIFFYIQLVMQCCTGEDLEVWRDSGNPEIRVYAERLIAEEGKVFREAKSVDAGKSFLERLEEIKHRTMPISLDKAEEGEYREDFLREERNDLLYLLNEAKRANDPAAVEAIFVYIQEVMRKCDGNGLRIWYHSKNVPSEVCEYAEQLLQAMGQGTSYDRTKW